MACKLIEKGIKSGLVIGLSVAFVNAAIKGKMIRDFRIQASRSAVSGQGEGIG